MDVVLAEEVRHVHDVHHCPSCRVGVANRDIKLENILLKAHETQPILKICDFGYSINENHSLPKTALGTPGYTGVSLSLSKLCNCLNVVADGLHQHEPGLSMP